MDDQRGVSLEEGLAAMEAAMRAQLGQGGKVARCAAAMLLAMPGFMRAFHAERVAMDTQCAGASNEQKGDLIDDHLEIFSTVFANMIGTMTCAVINNTEAPNVLEIRDMFTQDMVQRIYAKVIARIGADMEGRVPDDMVGTSIPIDPFKKTGVH